MADFIIGTREGAVSHITIDRPDEGNRVTNEMAAELAERIGAAGRDGSKLVLLRGAGENFCLGRELPPGAELDATAIGIRNVVTEPALAAFAAFHRCPVPIVAAVQGRAVGMGCAMAGLADITIAADNARFLVPEMDRDLPPTLVMWALADRVPRKAVSYLVYGREEMGAEAAFNLGLVSRVAPAGELDATIAALAAKMADNSGPALNAVKEYMRSAPEMDRQGAADLASNLLANVLASR